MWLGTRARSFTGRSVTVNGTFDRPFTGDWNGGERIFTVGARQRFDFERMVRIDSATGADVPMREGELDEMDGYKFTGSRTLRDASPP